MRDDDMFDPFRMMRRIEKHFSNMDRGMGFDRLKQGVKEPLVDMVDGEKEVKVTVELPGIDKKDIDLRVKDNNLIIRAMIKKSKDKKEENMVYSERSYQQYHRVVPLPDYVDDKHIEAKYNNGILEVKIPKKKHKKKDSDRIEVK